MKVPETNVQQKFFIKLGLTLSVELDGTQMFLVTCIFPLCFNLERRSSTFTDPQLTRTPTKRTDRRGPGLTTHHKPQNTLVKKRGDLRQREGFKFRC